MGAVYRGIQSSLDRHVAIKLLPPAVEQQEPAYAERFRNEARLMGRMNHPAIVSVYDFGKTADGQLYFVMEYVDGTDVQQMLARQGRLPAEHALAVTAHLCDALDYAHRQGVVHRDIKPSNVLIDREGRVKVADFGLAKLVTTQTNTTLTQTGIAMGTPDYVAPESLMLGVEVDGRADIYAVGVMLYQMLTGDIPRGMFKMPSQKFPGLDPRYDAIIRRALENDREERYQSSVELRRALDVILATPAAVEGQVSSAVLPKQPARPPGRTVVPTSGSGNVKAPSSKSAQPDVVPEPLPSASSLPYVLGALTFLAIGAYFASRPQTHHEVESTNVEQPSAVAVVDSAPPPVERKNATSAPQPPTVSAPVQREAKQAPTTPSMAPSASVPDAPARPVPMPAQPERSLPMPTVKPAASTTERLATLESQFQSAFEREVNAAYSDSLATLGSSYTAALERTLAEATRAGRLDEALALRDEKVRYTTHKFMPSIDPAGLHAAVLKLRETYRSAEKTYAQQRDATSLPLYDRYIEVLNAYERELQGQGRQGDAAKVRIKRDDVKTRRSQRAAKVPTGTQPFPSPASKTASPGN